LIAPQAARADDAGHDVSLTFSPIHLFLPVVELTAEVRLPVDFSVAAIGGYGGHQGVTLWEAGAQARYYLLGSFEHGMPIGVEALYIGAGDSRQGVRARATGLAVGPFIGYKFAADVGFTIDLAGGFQYVTLSASATDGSNRASLSENTIIPLINLNLGWSF
jgi:hypothetical protein